MDLVDFNPTRLALRVGNGEFLLELNLTPDGTGIARLSEVSPDGSVKLISCSFRNDIRHPWRISMGHYFGHGATPRAAAMMCIRKSIGLPDETSEGPFRMEFFDHDSP